MMRKIRIVRYLIIAFTIQTVLSVMYDASFYLKRPEVQKKQVWAIYNPLFGNPTTDKKYIGWQYKKSKYGNDFYEAPNNIPLKIFPQRGLYSTHNKTLIEEQMKEIASVGINALVVLWNGYKRISEYSGESSLYSEETIGMLLEAGKQYNVKVCVMIQSYDNRNYESLHQDMEYINKNLSTHSQYLKYKGRPVVFIFDPRLCTDLYKVVNEERNVSNPYFIGTISQLSNIAEAVESGIDAVYTYYPAVNQLFSSMISKWKIIKKESEIRGINFIPGVGTGLEEFQTDKVMQKTKSRRNGNNYKEMWKAAIENNNGIVIINSYNNWIDGTNIEPAVKKEGYKFDAVHWSGSNGKPEDFLEMTKNFVKEFLTAKEETK